MATHEDASTEKLIREALADAPAAQPDASGDSNSQEAPQEVTFGDVSGSVTLVDKSVNVIGRENAVSGVDGQMRPHAGEVLGRVLEVIAEARADNPPSMRELGEAAYEHFASAMMTCKAPDEIEATLELIRIRVGRQ